jgi:hypothetical protein
MDSSKKAADAIVAGVFVFLGVGALYLLQAYLLTLVASWFLPNLVLPFYKALVTIILLNLICK